MSVNDISFVLDIFLNHTKRSVFEGKICIDIIVTRDWEKMAATSISIVQCTHWFQIPCQMSSEKLYTYLDVKPRPWLRSVWWRINYTFSTRGTKLVVARARERGLALSATRTPRERDMHFNYLSLTFTR